MHLVAIALSLSAAACAAQQQQQQPPRGGQPPAEALAACKALKQGDTCSFSGERGAASGTCGAPEGRPLACRPANAPQAGAGMSTPSQ
jgi:hypothetical protein